MVQVPIGIRKRTSQDDAFIFNSWLHSFRSSHSTKGQRNEDYYRDQHKQIEKLLERSQVLLGCNTADEEQIYGWICFEPNILHYVYVKSPFRRLGIATRLIQHVDSPWVYTHETKWTPKVNKKYGSIYNPYWEEK